MNNVKVGNDPGSKVGERQITRREKFRSLRDPSSAGIIHLGNAVKNTSQKIF